VKDSRLQGHQKAQKEFTIAVKQLITLPDKIKVHPEKIKPPTVQRKFIHPSEPVENTSEKNIKIHQGIIKR